MSPNPTSSHAAWPLAEGANKLKDVFRSTQDSFDGSGNSSYLLPAILIVAGLIIVLALISKARSRPDRTRVKSINHLGKLHRELLKRLPLKAADLKQLKTVAGEQDCTHPLVLLLCPSLLAKAIPTTRADRKALVRLARRGGAAALPSPKAAE